MSLNTNMNTYNYPVQVGSIDENTWRMRDAMNKGLSDQELALEVDKLEAQLSTQANNRTTPPPTLSIFPGSKLIGSGWEWAVYLLSNGSQVVKVPSGAFLEVNEEEYLRNTEIAYKLCKEYLGNAVVDSVFERIESDSGPLNTIAQPLLKGEEIKNIDPSSLSIKSKQELKQFILCILKLIQEKKWAPDLYLRESLVDGKRSWKINNLMLVNEKPILFDFTSYIDPWRLYPEYTNREIIEETKLYNALLEDLG